jgi:predicted CoA-binding protein
MDVIGMARNNDAARQLQQQGVTVEIAMLWMQKQLRVRLPVPNLRWSSIN